MAAFSIGQYNLYWVPPTQVAQFAQIGSWVLQVLISITKFIY